LRHVVYGGAPMRPEKIRDAQACFGPVICTSYGQTEAPQVATFLPPEQMTGGDLASVGPPTFLMQIGIFGSDGQALPNGGEGEIALRGDLLMTGYLNAPAETAKALRNGWLFTGDAGLLDERGYLFIRDRIRDVIITGGFNVYPSDVEVVISAHPGIVDCAVIGVPDDKWGEAVHAAIQIRPGSALDHAELAALIKHELGSVKTPKEIHVFESLPKSPVGKVLKAEIRDEIVRRRSSKVREDAP
jgi:fatty-acyl-CoA synthase